MRVVFIGIGIIGILLLLERIFFIYAAISITKGILLWIL